MFADPFALNMFDVEHSDSEERWLLLGATKDAKILLVVHTARFGNVIRIISARKATKYEQKIYKERAK